MKIVCYFSDLISLIYLFIKGDDGLLPIDGQNGFPGQPGAMGPRGIPGVPGCNGSKVSLMKRKKQRSFALSSFSPSFSLRLMFF